MTRDEAIEAIAARRRENQIRGLYGFEEDATSLVCALEALGVLKLDEPSLLKRAAKYRTAGGYIEISPEGMSEACRLICDMAKELERK